MRLSYTDAYLPRGQAQEAAHGEDGEVQNTAVGGLVSVPHLLLPTPHEGNLTSMLCLVIVTVSCRRSSRKLYAVRRMVPTEVVTRNT